MFKKFASLALVATLVCSLGVPTAFAQNKPSLIAESNRVNDLPDSGSAANKEAQSSQGLKADIQKLVADAKAGKGLSVSEPQIQPRQSNSFSKAAKIGIIVGVALAVILVIVVVHAKNHLFDDFHPFRQ